MKRILLIQIGVGLIGGTTIEQVLAHRACWRERLGIDVGYAALVGGAGAIVAEDASGLSEAHLRRILAARKAGAGMAGIAAETGLSLRDGAAAIAEVAAMGAFVALDTAAGEGTRPLAERALALGGGVVFSNKAPLAMPAGTGDALWTHAGHGGRVRYETTCGAGLPVISTLRTLLDTGDEPLEITGTLSGTLGAIFADVAAGKPFSAAVRSAKALGYTEPDPRDDLSGLDVARKALILARTIGRRVDLAELRVESLVPPHLRGVGSDEFLDRAGELDAAMAERAAAARAEGKVLKYVARVTPAGPISVGVDAVTTATVLGALQGPENIVSIRTTRYDQYPLAISGPGAGAAVTAAGVVGDLLALATGPIGAAA